MSLTILFIFSIFLTLSKGLIQSTYEIFDLYSTDTTCFAEEVTPWAFSVAGISTSAKYYNCNNNFIIGGLNWYPNLSQTGQYFLRSYSDIPTHSSIRYSMSVFILDGWEFMGGGGSLGDYIELLFNTVSVNLFRVDPMNTQGNGGGYTTSYCGQTEGDLLNVQVFGAVSHSDTSFVLKVLSHMSGQTSLESYGIRDIRLTFADNPTLISPSLCAIAPVTIYDVSACSCSKGKYSTGPSGCTDCDLSCDSCFGAGPTQCYTCKEGYYFDGNQCSSCDSSCSRCSGPKNTQCTACSSGYLLFDKICIPTSRCSDSRFSISTCFSQCTPPCSTSTRSSWAESCFPNCPASPTNTILDFSGLCLSCTGISVTLNSFLLNKYHYDLTLTPSSCDLDREALKWHLQVTESKNPNILPTFSFIPTKTGTAKYQVDVTFVSEPSEASQLSFTYKYLSASAKVPVKNDEEETSTTGKELEEATKTTKAVIAGVITGGLIAAVAAGATTVLWSIISFQQFVGYFIYVNIDLPYHVEFFLSIISASSWDYLPNPLDKMTDEMYADLLGDNGQIPVQYQPPTKFQEYDVIPFFIKNGGTLLMTNLMLLLILLIVLGLKKIEQLKKNRVLVWMKVALKWTIITRTFLENTIPLSLAIFLQLRIMDFDNLYLAFCSGLSIISAIFVMTMIAFLMRVLAKRDNTHLEKPLIRRIYGTLYEGLQLKSSSKYYNLIILFRGVGFVCILVFLDASPLIQIIYTIFYNVFLIYYIFKAVTLEDFKLNIIVRIKEILILLGEICMLLLSAQVDSEKFYDVVGWIMIGALGSGVLLEAGYMLISQVFSMRATYRRILNIYYSLVVCIKGPDHDPQKKKVKVLKLQAREKGNLNEPSVIQMSESTFGNTSEIRVFRK